MLFILLNCFITLFVFFHYFDLVFSLNLGIISSNIFSLIIPILVWVDLEVCILNYMENCLYCFWNKWMRCYGWIFKLFLCYTWVFFDFVFWPSPGRSPIEYRIQESNPSITTKYTAPSLKFRTLVIDINSSQRFYLLLANQS